MKERSEEEWFTTQTVYSNVRIYDFSGRTPGWSALGLEIFLGLGAIGGGAALMLGPRGEIIPVPVSALVGTPFDTYFVPGLILFAVLGVGPLGAAALAWRRHPIAPLLALGVGLALLIWIAAQIAFIGYSTDPPLQAVYLLLGLLIALVGLGWLRGTGWTFSFRAP